MNKDATRYYSDNVADFSFREHLIKDLFLKSFDPSKATDVQFEKATTTADEFLAHLFENTDKAED